MGTINKKEFIEMYHRNTTNHGFFLINNNCTKNNDDLDEIYGTLKVPIKFIKK